MNTFSIVFLAFVSGGVALEWWLAHRQIQHVRANAGTVPEAFADSISLDAHRKAAAYTIARNRVGIVELFFSAAVLLAWTLGGGLELLDHAWRSLDWPERYTGVGFLVSLALIGTFIELPVSIYRTFVIEERFGFNKITARVFITDLVKGLLVSLVIGIPLVLLILWVMDSMGSYWWLYAWLIWSAFSLFLVWAYPSLISPLFNKFKPLENGEVMQRLEGLLARTGFRSKGVFVMDGSKRSTHGNAYFSGIGKNKRIVFFDTLLSTLAPDEVEAVMAHELGHFKLNHIKKRIALSLLFSLAGLAVLGWLMKQAWFFGGLGVSVPSTYMALALFMLAGPTFTVFLNPFFSWGSRKHEFEADAFAAQQADSNKLITALVKMYKENAKTLTPDPLHSIFYDSHPPAPVRIAHLQSRG